MSNTRYVDEVVKRVEAVGWRTRRMRDGVRIEGPGGKSTMLHFTYSDYRSMANADAELERMGLSDAERRLAVVRDEQRKLVIAADAARAAKRTATIKASATTKAVQRASGEYGIYGEEDIDWILFPHKHPAVRIYLVTPAMARRMLERNPPHNRKMRLDRANAISTMILNDEYLLGPDCFAFDWEGNVVNGQHRMEGIARSETPVLVFIAVGLDPKVYDIADTGLKRQASDTLRRYKSANPAGVSAIVRMVLTLRAHWKGQAWAKGISNDHVAREYEPNVDVYEWAQREAYRAVKLRPGLPGSAMGAVVYIARNGGATMDFLTEWLDGYSTGVGLTRGHPSLALRAQAEHYKEAGSGQRARTQIMVGQIIVAYNALVEGRTLNGIVSLRRKLDDPIPPIGQRK